MQPSHVDIILRTVEPAREHSSPDARTTRIGRGYEQRALTERCVSQVCRVGCAPPRSFGAFWTSRHHGTVANLVSGISGGALEGLTGGDLQRWSPDYACRVSRPKKPDMVVSTDLDGPQENASPSSVDVGINLVCVDMVLPHRPPIDGLCLLVPTSTD